MDSSVSNLCLRLRKNSLWVLLTELTSFHCLEIPYPERGRGCKIQGSSSVDRHLLPSIVACDIDRILPSPIVVEVIVVVATCVRVPSVVGHEAFEQSIINCI